MHGPNAFTDLILGDEEVQRTPLAVTDSICSFMFIRPFVRPPRGSIFWMRLPGNGSGVHVPLFHREAGRRGMGLEIGGTDLHRLFLRVISGQSHRHLREDAFVAPALPTVVQRFMRSVFSRRVTPS